VELEDAESVFNSKERTEAPTKDPINLMRKFMYMYGGFSNECTTACYDTWRYEIAYAPYAYYPKPTAAVYTRPGNYWEHVHKDFNSSPGRRWRHGLVAFQRR
jgi:TPP-dependent pyruvate/acetoin dehydrogenase alpha subunit